MKKLVKKSFSLFLAAILVINGFMVLNSLKAKATVSLPEVAIVSLDHRPFVEGDRNEFFIASKGYDGQVQYQLFYTCKTTMGTNWELIKNDDMVNGWTKPVQAHEPIKVDISGLNLKAEYYRFAIRVRRVGYQGKYSNKYGDYDNALPFVITVVKDSNIHLNGDMLIEKTEYTKNEKLIIDGVNSVESDTKYKLHLYDVKNNKWIKNLTEYEDKIIYDLNSIPAGKYVVDIWGKRSNSSKAYDGWKLKIIEVKEEKIPKIAMASLDHNPFVEGDNNKFFIASNGYDGEVQYQLFYTCKTTMGTNWELINNDDMVNGWTKPIDAHQPITVDISNLNLKADFYRFALRVRRVGHQGKYSNKYGDYDNALPFVRNVVKNANIYLDRDMLIEKTEYAKNDQLIINGVDGAESDTKYKLHLYDVKNNKWLINLTEYEDKIDYDLSNIPEGTYVVDTWCKKNGSSSKYDGWKLKIINVTSDIIKVTSVEDMETIAWKNSDYKLPQKVLATMEDGSHYKAVKWDEQADTSKEGVYIYEGTVLGYDKKVKLTLHVNDGRGNTPGNIINTGLVTSEDGWIYYCNPSDDGKLYKTSIEDGKIVKVSDDSALYINVVAGWVYYCNYSENGDGSIYKIKTDGTQRTKLNNDISEHVTIENEWIYYANASDEYKLYKVKTDGTVRTKINNDFSLNINLSDGYIYYTNMSDNNRAYRIKTDSTGRTKLNNDESAFVNVVGGWIYYANKSDNYKVYKMKTDGTGRAKISDESTAFLNVYDGWIYYSNLGRDTRLYKMKIDGTSNTRLNYGVTMLIQVVGDYVYYVNDSDDDKLYRIKNDGSEFEVFGVKINNIKDIEYSVYLGQEYKLPSEIEAEMEDGSKRKLEVNWNVSEVDTNKSGTYTFEGTVKGYNPKVILKLNVIGIDHLKESLIETTISKDKDTYYYPPSKVKAIMKDGKESMVSVTWDISKISKSEAGIYNFEGTIKECDEKVALKVIIIEIDHPVSDTFYKEIPRGANYNISRFFSDIKVVMNDGSEKVERITWTPSTVDINTVGEYILQGHIDNYDGKIELKVSVVENENNAAGAIIAKDGDWIYYKNVHDDYNIYKIKNDGTGKMKLLNKNEKILKIKDGYIYYNGEKKNNSGYYEYGLYKMKTDGTNDMKLDWYKPDSIEIVGNWIYYIYSSESKIYKLSTDGKIKTKVMDERVSEIYVENDSIYYTTAYEYGQNLFKIKLDGTDKTQMNNRPSCSIKIIGDWIYYIGYNKYYKDDGILYKIRKDGTGETKIFDSENQHLYVDNYYMGSDWIYVKENNEERHEYSIWKIKGDGTEKKLLSSNIRDANTSIYVYNDWICYTTFYDIYVVKRDGTANKKLVEGTTHIVNMVDGWIYYKRSLEYTEDNLIYKVRVDGTENQLVY